MNRQRGFNLIELVIAIVVLGIAVTGVLMAMTGTVARSADPMIREQSIAIGEAYLEEILSKAFSDPDGTDGEVTRAAFDDVDDYGALAVGPPADSNGTAIPALSDYTVTVTVVASAGLGPGAAQVPSADALRVDVNVSHPSGVDVTVSGYRTSY